MGTRLWLVRHTEAVTEQEDPARPLSVEGRQAARALGRFLRGCGGLEGADVCWHSPLVRSQETAALLLQEAAPNLARQEAAGIRPEDDPSALARRLEKCAEGGIVVVGHEPHLSALGTLLVRGKASPVQFRLRKGAVLALAATGASHRKSGLRRWEVRWLLAPELLQSAAD